MISAFKHIRLSGHNLIPLLDSQTDTLRLSLGGTGVAYYQELTGISGHLQGLIDIANADVNSIAVHTGDGLFQTPLQGSLKISGQAGITLSVDAGSNAIIIKGADSGFFQNLVNSLSGSLDKTGISLYETISSLSGTLNQTGAHIYANFVRKTTQQSFTTTLPTNIESTGILFPAAFSSTPSTVNVTLEVPGDVMYMTAIKNKSNTGYFAEFSDVILEAGVKLNTFASNPTNT